MAVRWLPILGGLFQDQLRQMAKKGSPFPDLLIAPDESSQSEDRAARFRVLPMVFPIVIYNGRPTWWPPLELRELVACPPGSEDLLPVSLRYSLLDVGRVPEGRLKDLGENLVAALVRLETSLPVTSRFQLLRQAELKLGPLDEVTRRRLESADDETLLRCADRILTAQTVADLF